MLKEGRDEEFRVLLKREAGIDVGVVAVRETDELAVPVAAEVGIDAKLKTSVEVLQEIGINIKVMVKIKRGRKSRVEL